MGSPSFVSPSSKIPINKLFPFGGSQPILGHWGILALFSPNLLNRTQATFQTLLSKEDLLDYFFTFERQFITELELPTPRILPKMCFNTPFYPILNPPLVSPNNGFWASPLPFSEFSITKMLLLTSFFAPKISLRNNLSPPSLIPSGNLSAYYNSR